MIVKERKGWKNLNIAFDKWYTSSGAGWTQQRNWLSKELVKRNYVKEKQLPEMWVLFRQLTDNCSSWKFQSKVLSFITLCLDKEIGEDLDRFIK